MGKFFKYNAGDTINGFLMLERTAKKKNNWYGLFQCPYCGKIFEAQIQHIRNGGVKSCGCQRLYGLASPNYPEDKRNVLDLTGQHFGYWTVLYPVGQKEEYSNRSMYWHCRCRCGAEKDVSSQSLCSGTSLSCGCFHSYGEQKIRQGLNDLKINYVTEKIFKDCFNPKTQQYLRFDFYLPNYNCCIEYDGEQHFREYSSSWFYKDSLQERQEKDSIKNNWCQKHNISLIRIPYQERDNINTKMLYQLIIRKEVINGSKCKILQHYPI